MTAILCQLPEGDREASRGILQKRLERFRDTRAAQEAKPRFVIPLPPAAAGFQRQGEAGDDKGANAEMAIPITMGFGAPSAKRPDTGHHCRARRQTAMHPSAPKPCLRLRHDFSDKTALVGQYESQETISDKQENHHERRLSAPARNSAATSSSKSRSP